MMPRTHQDFVFLYSGYVLICVQYTNTVIINMFLYDTSVYVCFCGSNPADICLITSLHLIVTWPNSVSHNLLMISCITLVDIHAGDSLSFDLESWQAGI